MEVVILAAGEGSRLGDRLDTLPKLFLEISGKTVFEHQIEALLPLIKSNHLRNEVTVVLGHGFDNEFDHRNPTQYLSINMPVDVNPVIFEEWNQFENAASAEIGVDSLKGDDSVLLLCGDVIFSEELISQFVSTFESNLKEDRYSAVGAFRGEQDEMTAVQWDDTQIITDYGKIEGHQEAGIFALHREHIEDAKNIWSANQSNKWFPVVFPELASKAITLPESEHFEINTPDHLLKAQSSPIQR